MICCTNKSSIFSHLKWCFETLLENNNECHSIISLKSTNLIFIFFLVKLIIKVIIFFMRSFIMNKRCFWQLSTLLLIIIVLLILNLLFMFNIKFMQLNQYIFFFFWFFFNIRRCLKINFWSLAKLCPNTVQNLWWFYFIQQINNLWWIFFDKIK